MTKKIQIESKKMNIECLLEKIVTFSKVFMCYVYLNYTEKEN